MHYTYYAEIRHEETGEFGIYMPDLPEVITGGKTKEEALDNAQEALGLALCGRYADNEEIPAAAHKQGIPIMPDAWTISKLAVLEAFRREKITKTELAQRLGKQEAEARRILDPYHFTKLQTLERALEAMGKLLVISVRDKPRRTA